MGTKYVYSFNEGNKDMKSLLGGKGANLAEMTKIGLPVPPGFTISTEACNDYYVSNKTIKPEIVEQIEEKLAQLESELGKKIRLYRKPIISICSFRCSYINARYDGYNIKLRFK